MKVVFALENRPTGAHAVLKEAGHELVFGMPANERYHRLSDDELAAMCVGAECLVYHVISRRTLELLPGLTTVVSPYVGFDNIDVPAATDMGVLVCNTVTSHNAISTAEGAVTLLLAVAKRLMRRTARLRRGGWTDDADGGVLISGSTVGIVGLGRIGSGVARRLAGWDVRLLVHTRTPRPDLMEELGAEPVDLPTLLGESDFVTLHVPLTAETRGLMGETQLRSMKPSAALINTSRGLVVDEAALISAIVEDRIAGAALDVFAREPLPPDSPLRDLDTERVILTPHAMSGSVAGRAATKRRLMETVLTALSGEIPGLALNPELPNWRGRG